MEQLQNNHSCHIVDGDHDGHHHGRQNRARFSEQTCSQGDRKQHKIAAVDSLNHHASLWISLHKFRHQKHQDKLQQQYAPDSCGHQTSVQRKARFYLIQIIKHQNREKSPENQLVQLVHKGFVHQTAHPDSISKGYINQKRHNCVDGHKKTLHTVYSSPLPEIIKRWLKILKSLAPSLLAAPYQNRASCSLL